MYLSEPTNHFLYPAASFFKRGILLHRCLKLKYIEITGTGRDKSPGAGLIYIGEGESYNYLKNLYFTDVEKETKSFLSLKSLRTEIRRLFVKDALFFVEINRSLGFMIPSFGHLTFPWIKQRVSLRSKDYLSRKRRMDETAARKVRKYKYRFSTTQEEGSVEKFYKEYYSPYIKRKFKNEAFLRSMGEFRRTVRSGFLLKVFDDEQWVCGAVCGVKGDCVTTLAFGMVPDYEYHSRRGALSSVYYFVFRWAEENSIRTVDLLRSRPYTEDGVYEHKRRWGGRPEKDAWPHTAIWIFIPKRSNIPQGLGRHLVWDGRKFVELEKTQ